MTVYLDHAATTPMREAAISAYTEALRWLGNPSSLHAAGREARRRVEQAREEIAATYGAHPSEVVFTSGGTESDNLALKGTYFARREQDSRRTRVLVSAVEHPAVLDAAQSLRDHHGARVELVPCERDGRVTTDALVDVIGDDVESVAVAAVMWANNEVGVVNDVTGIGAACRELGIPLHTDAVQAAPWLPVDFTASGATSLAISAHKLGGPVGTGALLVRRDAPIVPIADGGGQERRLRSGTVDVRGIVAFAAAAAEAAHTRVSAGHLVVGLRDEVLVRAPLVAKGIAVGGAWVRGSVVERLPNNAHLVIEGAEADSLLYLLDQAGIAVSAGSACAAGVARPSHVLSAMGLDESAAKGALRVTLGHTSTRAEVDALLAALPDAVARSRAVTGWTA